MLNKQLILFLVLCLVNVIYANNPSCPKCVDEPTAKSHSDGTPVCGLKHGCKDGYCWSQCSATMFYKYEWCWTTQDAPLSRNWVTCTKDEDCCAAWSCGGACSV